MSNKNKYFLAFSCIPCIGPVKFGVLRKSFTSLEEAWNAPITKLEQIGFSQKNIAEIIRLRNEINIDQELEKLEKENIKTVTIDDEEYPKLLKEIYYPPYILYYRGTLPNEDEFLLSVVGSRKYTQYGKQITQNIVYELAQNKLVIISGLALGIDALAHEATLQANAKTIAVLGCGIEPTNIYPMHNRILSERIISKGGCIMSEHPIGTPPYKSNFPRRNRIISGLSLGTLVIEAAEKSGALITAKYCLEQNREVFAVPGPITSETSQGTNNLIKMGARPVTQASDVLDSLNLKQAVDFVNARKITADSTEEAKILEHLNQEPRHVDELGRLTNMPASAINSTLTLMEMKGKVRHLGGMQYVLAR